MPRRDGLYSLFNDDALKVLPTLEANSFDSLVTDPPAGIGFMGKHWDRFDNGKVKGHRQSQQCLSGYGLTDGGNRLPVPSVGGHSVNPTCRKCKHRERTWNGGPPKCECDVPDFDRGKAAFTARSAFISFLTEVAHECLRVLKPGAFGLVWALPRTSHWTATALEDAGYEIRDAITDLHSPDPIVRAFRKSLTPEQEGMFEQLLEALRPSFAQQVFGTGFPKGKSCMKPSVEMWWLVRKPGKMQPLQIDECRIATTDSLGGGDQSSRTKTKPEGWDRPWMHDEEAKAAHAKRVNANVAKAEALGRWPANLALTCCGEEPHTDDCPVRLLDEQAGPSSVTGKRSERSRNAVVEGTTWGTNNHRSKEYANESGNVSRFFYCSKASRCDRGEGNTHPTVKSTKLMEWLVKLVTPPGGKVLDPFMGSGSTGVAALRCGRLFVGVESDMEHGYFQIAQRRIAEAVAQRTSHAS